MDKNILLKVIKQEISDLYDIVASFDPEEKIHKLSFDICLAKIKNLTDELLLLKEIELAQNNLAIEATDNASIQLKERDDQIAQERVRQEDLRQLELDNERKEKERLDREQAERETKERLESERILREESEKKERERLEKEIENREQLRREQVKRDMEKLEREEQELRLREMSRTETKANLPLTPYQDSKVEEKKDSAIRVKNSQSEKALKKVLGEELGSKKKSLHDFLAENNTDKALGSQFKQMPISDIHKAIPLNDRIWFIKHLFNENPDSYQKTIDALNRSESLHHALEIIQSKYDWDSDSKIVEKFLRIISRKFQ